eukprot:3262077-Rhodomonas_salina.1
MDESPVGPNTDTNSRCSYSSVLLGIVVAGWGFDCAVPIAPVQIVGDVVGEELDLVHSAYSAVCISTKPIIKRNNRRMQQKTGKELEPESLNPPNRHGVIIFCSLGSWEPLNQLSGLHGRDDGLQAWLEEELIP